MDKGKQSGEEVVVFGSKDLGVTVLLKYLKRGAVIEVHTNDPAEMMLLVIPAKNADKLKMVSEDLVKGLLGLPCIFFQAFLTLLDMDVDQIEENGNRIGEVVGKLIDETIEIAEGKISRPDLILMNPQ